MQFGVITVLRYFVFIHCNMDSPVTVTNAKQINVHISTSNLNEINHNHITEYKSVNRSGTRTLADRNFKGKYRTSSPRLSFNYSITRMHNRNFKFLLIVF